MIAFQTSTNAQAIHAATGELARIESTASNVLVELATLALHAKMVIFL